MSDRPPVAAVFCESSRLRLSGPRKLRHEGRNVLVGPDYFTWDFSTFKIFPIREQTHLEFRGEFFKFTNHTNFALPNNVVGDTNFGQITATNSNPRDIQFALRSFLTTLHRGAAETW